MQQTPDISQVLNSLKSATSEACVIDEISEREYVSQDYYRKTDPVAAVIRPQSVEDLATAVKELTAAGVAIFPRGGGYSYTDAYLPTQSPGVCIDTRTLNRIVHVDEQDMYVTAEAGCTWKQLYEHLQPLGLRTPFWGPLSGRNATLGGGISQGSLSLGSGKFGPSSESVLGFEVVLADGSLFKTGSASQVKHSAFFRHYGPDLTGLFCNDAGALGIKARVTLRLQKAKPLNHGLSFGFDDFASMAQAMAKVAALNIATENSGLTMSALRRAATQKSFAEDIRIFLQVAKSGPSFMGSVASALKMAFAGRRYISDSHSTANFVVEGHNAAHLNGQIRAVRAAVSGLGVEIPNTVPTVMRAEPFADYDMLHPDGRRQLPMHTILPHSRTVEFNTKYLALMEDNRQRMEDHGVTQLSVYSGVSTNGFLFEPVLLWTDAVEEFHNRHTSDAVLSQVDTQEPNVAARELVEELRQGIVDVMYQCGGVHMQIGKVYPYMKERDPNQISVLRDLKKQLDPNNLINPGALGLS